MHIRSETYRASLLLLFVAACGSSPRGPAPVPAATPSATHQTELRAEHWGNAPCSEAAPGPHLTFVTGPTRGAPGEQLLGSATLTPDRKLPASIALGDRQFDVRAFFRKCHEGRLQYLGVGITHDRTDKAIGFSPPLAVYAHLPRKDNACELDLARFKADSCPGHADCTKYAALTNLHACSNQLSIPLSTRTEPPNAEEKARGVDAVVFVDQVGVVSYKADPVSGDFSEIVLERRIVRSESNPSMHD